MEVITRFPRSVREIVNAEIPLSDGTRLAARMWLPEDAERNPVPAILEYLPYRKRDGTSERVKRGVSDRVFCSVNLPPTHFASRTVSD